MLVRNHFARQRLSRHNYSLTRRAELRFIIPEICSRNWCPSSQECVDSCSVALLREMELKQNKTSPSRRRMARCFVISKLKKLEMDQNLNCIIEASRS